ncbi:conserved hypothetical protein [Streptomyces scabiei 87.22]|uniref:DUF4253 domain-containing protein n=1 Tax=Streptomyces scabiei (strain 87.22) TaxID=680198 RepID=C9YZB4_STRSW|nr:MULTISPECIES: DUF4253 domain-containing protein [Streptomyces]MBP5861971.1 DUF4253 domain-containing protein [Streptomyces sp. LBUM 1484]MBP5901379.1 DUF4253 domain-containing protein [Streptomyces sp. LBUM 1488]MDX2577329.1 DUF4253 domain-containing protein [Streptomyces scabiei]MDX2657186.1 DUF4253 domain-containing protein [Streptomyces scabiei]MDX2719951.1 DUF4253 domain-containing protein [Streptomyces scabiei]
MATLPNPLPQLAADPSGRVLGLELPLPQGRLIDATDDGPWHEPLLWCADEPATKGSWTAVQPARRTAGLLPVLLDVGDGRGGPERWGLRPGEMSYPGDHDADEVLAEFWDDHALAEDPDWPGLAEALVQAQHPAPDPDTHAADTADALVKGPSRLRDFRIALVPARRSADIPAAIGWTGPLNHENDVARLCAVLRSWEDRFGIRVVALAHAELVLSVAAPPTTEAEAEAVADEHFAFCPDNISQDTDNATRPAYARTLLNAPLWSFWWD